LPFDIATLDMLPNGAKNYAPLLRSNVLAVINNATETQNPNVPVGSQPENVAITPDGTKAYVTNKSDGTVTVVDTSTDTVIATITVGSAPLAITATPDSTQVYVLNFNDGTVSVIDTATNTVSATITVGTNPRSIAITPNGLKAYVSDATTSDVFVIDTTTNTVITSIGVGANPGIVSITPNGMFAYVMNIDGNSVSVINTLFDTVIATVNVGDFPEGQVISPDGKKVFVVNNGDDTVSVIDTATNTVIDTIDVGIEPTGIGITADQAPLAQFTINVQPLGQPTVFDASTSNSPTGTIATYFWDFGDGNTATTTLPVITHVYNAPGTYFVTLIVTNTAGTSLTQIFYFSSSTTEVSNIASPVTNNNGGPTAIRVHALTIGIAPPSNFIGCVKTNEFLNKTEHILNAVFTASPTPGVLFYQIFQNGVLVKQIPANAAVLHFQLCLRSKHAAREITVVAVGAGGLVSMPLPITIVGSCCSINDIL
jgi:YVTN family beta-propeller protein